MEGGHSGKDRRGKSEDDGEDKNAFLFGACLLRANHQSKVKVGREGRLVCRVVFYRVWLDADHVRNGALRHR